MTEVTEKMKAEALQKLLPDVYADVAQPGMRVLGKAIGGAIHLCVLPLIAAGTLAERVNIYLQHNLHDYEKKLEGIPEEKIIEVPPQVAVPVIQKLTYTTNQDIANLFTNLLTTASNCDTINVAHPGFEHIISQLSSDEARIIQYLNHVDDIQYCELHARLKNDGGFLTFLHKSTLIPFKVKLDYADNIRAYLANLVRLGIIVDMVGLYRTDNTQYDLIKSKYDFGQYDKDIPEKYERVEINKGYYAITEYGRMFITACTDK